MLHVNAIISHSWESDPKSARRNENHSHLRLVVPTWRSQLIENDSHLDLWGRVAQNRANEKYIISYIRIKTNIDKSLLVYIMGNS